MINALRSRSGGMMFDKRRLTFPVLALILVFFTHFAEAQEPGPSDEQWSVNIGPNAKNWGYLGITKDYLMSDRLSLFVTGGLGTILIGGGVAYYARSFSGDSLVLSATAGILGAHGDVCYQWSVGERGFITAGVSYGTYFLQYQGFLPVLSYEVRF